MIELRVSNFLVNCCPSSPTGGMAGRDRCFDRASYVPHRLTPLTPCAYCSTLLYRTVLYSVLDRTFVAAHSHTQLRFCLPAEQTLC